MLRTAAKLQFLRRITTPAENAQKSMSLGIECWDKGLIPEAQSHFASSITHLKTSDNLFNLANCLLSTGKKAEALQAYKDSLAIERRHDTLLNIANVLGKSVLKKPCRASQKNHCPCSKNAWISTQKTAKLGTITL